MAVCYLFANYEVQYKCKYNITKDFIEVETDYDIEEETYRDMEQRAQEMLKRMEQLLAGADRGKILREGLV